MITRRALGLLTIAFFRHASTALFCLSYPGDVAKAPSFRVIRAVLPLHWWSLMFALCAAVLLIGMTFGREKLCRIGMVFSAALTGTWVAGFILAIYTYGIPPSPMLPIAWAALLFKDLIIVSGPLTRAAIIKSIATTA